MPRKKRHPKRRPVLPTGLATISCCERAQWAVYGPLLEVDVTDETAAHLAGLYTVWPSWDVWAAFYGAVRDELYAARPHLRDKSAAEAIYLVYIAGGDPVETMRAIRAEQIATDPRRTLCPAN